MKLIAIAVVVLAVLALLVPLGMRELAKWDKRHFPIGLKLLKVVYWAAAVALWVWIVFFMAAEEAQELLMYASLGYFVAAAAVYRLLLRFAFLASGTDAYEREVRESEGDVQLRLTDRERGRAARHPGD